MSAAPAVIVHGLPMALAAVRAGWPVTLLSAEGAALYAGVGWWRALVAAVRQESPDWRGEDILDCGAAPGRALEALRCGQKLIVLRAAAPVWADIAGRAEECGARLLPAPPPALDLAGRAAGRRLAAWLSQGSRGAGGPAGPELAGPEPAGREPAGREPAGSEAADEPFR
jgi:hypothetical protein